MIKYSKLEELSDKLLERDNYFRKLKSISLKGNYTKRILLLKERINQELDLWRRKNPSAKLLDLEKDLNFLESQKDDKNLDKFRIDILSEKYSING